MRINETDQFLNSPVLYLMRTPVQGQVEGNGLATRNFQIMTTDDINFSFLRPTPRGELGALFYVLAWSHNSASTGTLGSDARFFFTGPLSGCMFAVDKNWYRPRVTHVNQTLNTGAMDVVGMRGMVRNQMAQCTSWMPWVTGPNITVVRSDNRPNLTTYNIFGYRTGGGWTFWRQVVDVNAPDDRTVRSLDELDTWF